MNIRHETRNMLQTTGTAIMGTFALVALFAPIAMFVDGSYRQLAGPVINIIGAVALMLGGAWLFMETTRRIDCGDSIWERVSNTFKVILWGDLALALAGSAIGMLVDGSVHQLQPGWVGGLFVEFAVLSCMFLLAATNRLVLNRPVVIT